MQTQPGRRDFDNGQIGGPRSRQPFHEMRGKRQFQTTVQSDHDPGHAPIVARRDRVGCGRQALLQALFGLLNLGVRDFHGYTPTHPIRANASRAANISSNDPNAFV